VDLVILSYQVSNRGDKISAIVVADFSPLPKDAGDSDRKEFARLFESSGKESTDSI
jgi:hypothetical protein